MRWRFRLTRWASSCSYIPEGDSPSVPPWLSADPPVSLLCSFPKVRVAHPTSHAYQLYPFHGIMICNSIVYMKPRGFPRNRTCAQLDENVKNVSKLVPPPIACLPLRGHSTYNFLWIVACGRSQLVSALFSLFMFIHTRQLWFSFLLSAFCFTLSCGSMEIQTLFRIEMIWFMGIRNLWYLN